MNKPAFLNRLSPRLITLSQILIILLVGIAAYANAMYGPFHFDDAGITDKNYLWPRAFNPTSRQFADLTFVLNHLLHGKQVFGYHLVNLAVHVAASLALFGLVGSAVTALQTSPPSPIAKNNRQVQGFLELFLPFGTALIFVCHPIQTQAVSYIVQRYASLAALFYFCSVTAFIRARISSTRQQSRQRTVLLFAAALLSALLAMRSKETAYTLPLMLLVIEIFLFQGRLLKNRMVVGGMLLTLLAITLLRIAQLSGSDGFEGLLSNVSHSTREELTYSRADYFLTQIRVVASYLRLLFFPVNQNLDYDIGLQKSLFTLPVLASLALHLCLLGSSAVLFRRSAGFKSAEARQQGICLRLASLGIVWFYLTLLVESSIIPILDVMFEHRIYLPSGGGILAVVSFAAAVAGQKQTGQKLLWGWVALTCCIFTIATVQRNRIWNDDLLLWEDTARKSPNKPRVLANLASVYLDARKPDQALPLLVRTLEIAPGMRDPLINLGMALELTEKYAGRFDNGQSYIENGRAIKMRYYNAWFANTRNNLGLAYEYLGRPDEAIRCYEAAVTLLPSFELAWYNLYLAAAGQKNALRAQTALKKLWELNPQRAREAELLTARTP